MAKKDTANEVAVVETNTAVALADAPFDLSQVDQGQQFDSNDVTIPYISILQKLSPQVDEANVAYIESAKAGQLFNTATQECLEEVVVVPVSFKKYVVEWKTREEGGGFIAQHPADYLSKVSTTVNDKNQHINEEGNMLVETAYYYVVTTDAEGNPLGNAVISMASSALKTSRQWNSMLQNISRKLQGKSAFCSQAFKVKTGLQTNKSGRSWYGWTIEPIGWTSRVAFEEAVMFQREVLAGEVTVAPESEVTEQDNKTGDDSIPF